MLAGRFKFTHTPSQAGKFRRSTASALKRYRVSAHGGGRASSGTGLHRRPFVGGRRPRRYAAADGEVATRSPRRKLRLGQARTIGARCALSAARAPFPHMGTFGQRCASRAQVHLSSRPAVAAGRFEPSGTAGRCTGHDTVARGRRARNDKARPTASAFGRSSVCLLCSQTVSTFIASRARTVTVGGAMRHPACPAGIGPPE